MKSPHADIFAVVMDGAHARLFKVMDITGTLHQIADFRGNRELNHQHGSEKPGRVFSSASIVRHSYEKESDWHEMEKERFVKNTLQKIQQHLLSVEEDCKVYLIAPSHVMGILHRFHLNWEKNFRLIELEKDLANARKETIEKEVQKILKPWKY